MEELIGQLVNPDVGLFIWTILTFLALLTLLTKFAWRPLLAALEARQAAISAALDDAQRAKVELQRLEQESAQIIRAARADAEALLADSRADADRLREELRQKAKAEAEGILKNAERQIQLETARALQQLRSETVDLSVTIATRILQRNISKEDNERLITEALQQVEGHRH